MLEAVAEEGESDVKAQSESHRLTGRFHDGIKGRVASLGGKHWLRTAVISQTAVYPWANGGAKQYRGRQARGPLSLVPDDQEPAQPEPRGAARRADQGHELT
jgi:hypothetical protein